VHPFASLQCTQIRFINEIKYAQMSELAADAVLRSPHTFVKIDGTDTPTMPLSCLPLIVLSRKRGLRHLASFDKEL
jgi:hypothetical protein